MDSLLFKNIELNVNWSPELDVPVSRLPKSAGIYAEIHWRSHGVRIGESVNIKYRIAQATGWFKGMHNGTEHPNQLRRNNIFCQAAKRDGHEGFSHYVVSTDSRLHDKELRKEVEFFLFDWVASHALYKDFNFQKGYRNTLGFENLIDAEMHKSKYQSP